MVLRCCVRAPLTVCMTYRITTNNIRWTPTRPGDIRPSWKQKRVVVESPWTTVHNDLMTTFHHLWQLFLYILPFAVVGVIVGTAVWKRCFVQEQAEEIQKSPRQNGEICLAGRRRVSLRYRMRHTRSDGSLGEEITFDNVLIIIHGCQAVHSFGIWAYFQLDISFDK